MKILEGLEPESHRVKLEKQYWIYWSRISNATYKRDNEEIIRLTSISSEISDFISTYKENFRPDQQIRFMFVFAIFLLNNDKYTECRNQLKMIINDFGKKAQIRQDIVVVTHLLLLICDFHLRDIFDLTSHILSTESYFKKAQDFRDDSKLVLIFFKEISYLQGKISGKSIELVLNTIKNWNVVDHPILKYFDFKSWFEKIESNLT
jgi:hypothetical protein